MHLLIETNQEIRIVNKNFFITLSLLALSAFLLSALPLLAAGGTPSPWEPYGATMVIEGERVLVEVKAVDETRHHVLATKYLLLEVTRGSRSSLQIFEAGVLEHEDHAQVRLRLREGDYFALEMLERPAAAREDKPPAVTVSITVREDEILARGSADGGPVGSLVLALESD